MLIVTEIHERLLLPDAKVHHRLEHREALPGAFFLLYREKQLIATFDIVEGEA